MGWADPDSFLTRLFSGDPLAILLSFIVSITLPALLHWYFYTQSAQEALSPTFVLLGPSGAGKTSLITLLQRQFAGDAEPSLTRPSQESSTARLFLSTTVPLGSNKYRSENDFESVEASKNPTKYLAVDTPGHGKLRLEHALSQLTNPALKGVIFVVDSSALDVSDPEVARDTATYLHDVLLTLQRRPKGKPPVNDMAVLIAANKQDLFTALPAGAIKDRLQTELEQIRKSKSRGITSVDADPDVEDEEDILGGAGEDKFTFQNLEDEFGITVDVVEGFVKGADIKKGVRKWEEWIGSCL